MGGAGIDRDHASGLAASHAKTIAFHEEISPLQTHRSAYCRPPDQLGQQWIHWPRFLRLAAIFKTGRTQGDASRCWTRPGGWWRRRPRTPGPACPTKLNGTALGLAERLAVGVHAPLDQRRPSGRAITGRAWHQRCWVPSRRCKPGPITTGTIPAPGGWSLSPGPATGLDLGATGGSLEPQQPVGIGKRGPESKPMAAKPTRDRAFLTRGH